MLHVWGHRPTGTTPARPVWPTAASKVLFLCQISREGWLPCCGTQTPRKGTEWPALGLQLQTIWAGGVASGDKGGKTASPTALSTGWLRDKQTDTSARFSPLKLKKNHGVCQEGTAAWKGPCLVGFVTPLLQADLVKWDRWRPLWPKGTIEGHPEGCQH